MLKTYNIGELDNIARSLWAEGKAVTTWAFDAPMGAGKTTLIHKICEILQVSEPVSSPTFALINEYFSAEAGIIYHMDWYRLKDTAEAIQAGMEDALLSGHYCFIEWPEKAAELLPANTFHIRIELADENTRKISTSFNALPKKN